MAKMTLYISYLGNTKIEDILEDIRNNELEVNSSVEGLYSKIDKLNKFGMQYHIQIDNSTRTKSGYGFYNTGVVTITASDKVIDSITLGAM